MNPNDISDRNANGSAYGDEKPRKAQKSRRPKKSEQVEEEPVIKTTTRRPKPTKESPIPSPIPRYNPSIRDAKRSDVPPPPVGYMIDDDEDDGLDNYFDFDSEDMQQTVADRPSRSKNRNKRESARGKGRGFASEKAGGEAGTDPVGREANSDNGRSNDDKKRQNEKTRQDKSKEEPKQSRKEREDRKQKNEKKPVQNKPEKPARKLDAEASTDKPVVKEQVKPESVEQDPSSDTLNLLAEIKRKIKQELIEELRKELQDELREELKRELGLGKRPVQDVASEPTSVPEKAVSEQPAHSPTTEKKTTFREEKSDLTAQTGKKKAISKENEVTGRFEDFVSEDNRNRVSKQRAKKDAISDPVSEVESVERDDVKADLSERVALPPVDKKPSATKKKPKSAALSADNENSASKSPQAEKTSGKKIGVEKKVFSQKKQSVKADVSPAPDNSPAESEPEPDWSNNKFSQFNLKPEIMRALNKFNYLAPTPIQQGVIPLAATRRDVMGQAQTGTGKTAAFSLPILQKLEFDETMFSPRALILVPTRELAVQVRDEILRLGKYTGLAIAAFYGGAPLQKQTLLLSDGVDIAVGTPGRIIDLFTRRALDLSKLEFVVLDEADRMLDIGFRPDIEKILRRCPDSRQTLLMSATIPPEVDHLARHYMNNPEKLDFSPKNLAVDTIEQSYFSVAPERKVELLKRLLERENPHQAIIFCRTKKRTEQLTNIVKKWYSDAQGMHGDMEQDKRMKTIQKFRDGKIRFLIATDVVGRGLDISGISHIINYDIPQFCDDYVHRVGRTGRMGRDGVAFTFVTAEEGVELTRIEMRINKLLKRDEIPGFAAFVSPSASSGKPETEGQQKSEPISEEAPKPIFGQRIRKIRRAL